MFSGSIAGTVFNDADSSGLMNGSEAGLSAWVVYLDQNQNGQLDVGETSVNTASNGTFTLSGLSAGTFYVASQLQSGWVATAPGGNSYTVTLATDENATDKDFGRRYENVVDDGDASYAEAGTWATSTVSGAYNGDYRSKSKGTGTGTATWTFGSLPSGYYRVQTTWQVRSDGTADAPFTVSDNTTPLAMLSINQRTAPADEVALSKNWETLGIFQVSSGTLNIKTTDGFTDGTKVVADAVRVIQVAGPDSTPSVIDDGDLNYAEAGTWAPSFNSAAQDDEQRIRSKGTGAGTASWTFAGLTSGYYRVLTTWQVRSDGVSDAPYTILDGTTSQALLRVNQKIAPAYEQSGGQWWENLGVVNITSGTLDVKLTDAATDGTKVIADAVRIVPVAGPDATPGTIDDGEMGYTEAGAWTGSTVSAALGGEQRIATSGSGAKNATWSFGSLASGYYKVQTSWQVRSSDGTADAPYTVLDGTTSQGTQKVNQLTAPADEQDQGRWWETLGTFQITSGTLNVKLTDAFTNGTRVVADAVRIVAVAGPASPPEMVDDGELTYAEAGTAWAVTTNSAATGGDYRTHSKGSGTNAATWTLAGLASGYYEVFTTWQVRSSDGTADAPYTILDGTTSKGTLKVNQLLAPADEQSGGQSWESLGTYQITGGTLNVKLSDAFTNGTRVVADAVRIVPVANPGPSPDTIDDGDQGFITAGSGWTLNVDAAAYGGDYYTNLKGTGADMVTWKFSNLAAGYYKLLTTWQPRLNDGTAGAQYIIYDNTTAEGSPYLSQLHSPTGVLLDGREWAGLGTYYISSGTLNVYLPDNFYEGTYIVADAVRIVHLTEPDFTIRGLSDTHEGQTYELYTDGDGPIPGAPLEWTFDWGDGVVETVSSGPITHVYTDGFATHTITAQISDGINTYYAHTLHGESGLAVTVHDVAPTLEISGQTETDEGSLYTLNAIATDPGDDTISGWVIDWGDESSPTTSVTHTYDDGPNANTIVASATNEDSEFGVHTLIPDASFGTDGQITSSFGVKDSALQPDGKLVLLQSQTNSSISITRYNPDGSLDNTFGTDGTAVNSFGASFTPKGLALQPDGKTIIVGESNQDFAIARLTSSGALDTTFGTGGKVTTDFGGNWSSPTAVVVQTDGKIVVAGQTVTASNPEPFHAPDIAIARFNSNGQLDTSFGTSGKRVTNLGRCESVESVAIQADGKLVVAGTQLYEAFDSGDFFAARYTTAGTLDTSFGSGGKVVTNFGLWEEVAGIAIQSDGKILLAGFVDHLVGLENKGFDVGLVRYTNTGALDLTFGTGGMVKQDFTPYGAAFDVNDYVNSVLVQDDGKVLLAGGGEAMTLRCTASIVMAPSTPRLETSENYLQGSILPLRDP